MTPLEVKNEVLARIKGWQSIQEKINEVMTGPNGQQQTYKVTLVSAQAPKGFRLKVVPKTGTPYEVVFTGLNTIEYQRGSRHYSVFASNPSAWSIYRILGPDLGAELKQSHVQTVSVNPTEAVLHMTMPIAAGVESQATLWFDLATNAPSKLKAVWKGGSVEEVLTQVHVNPTVPSSEFAFTPPVGVRPQLALSPQGTEIVQAQSRVAFPIVLPPSSQNLQLNAVDVSSKAGKRVVLLTYLNARQNPLVITEEKAARFKPPAGISMVTESVGTRTVQVGSMPDGDEMAALTLQKTLVVIEGPTVTVDDLVNAWAAGITSAPPPSSP